MRSSVSRSSWLVGTALVFAIPDGRAEATCPADKCGVNSPYVNSFPVNGLNLDGEANLQGVRLIPESLIADPAVCQGAVRLGIEAGAFVGVAGDGEVACEGRALLGARFSIEMNSLPMRITITNTTLVRTWDPRRGRLHEKRAWVRAYRLQPDQRDATSICRNHSSWLEELDVPEATTAPPPDHEATAWSAVDDLALLVVGELYDGEASVVALPGAARPERWFNIACQGGAIAKMRLLGYDPDPTSPRAPAPPIWAGPRGRNQPPAEPPAPADERDERQATLKMITGKYCGQRSHTAPGTRVSWTPLDRDPDRRKAKEIEADANLEAFWRANGAVCLSTPRVPLTEPLECTPPPVCTEEMGRDPSVYWVTRKPVSTP